MKRDWIVTGILGLVAAIVYFAPRSGNLLAPLCGILAVVLIYRLVGIFVASSPAQSDELRPRESGLPVTLAGAVAAVVFMLTPAVRLAAAQHGPRLPDLTWALLIAIALIAFPLRPRRLAAPALSLSCALAGAAWALGLADSALFLAILPLYLLLILHVSRRVGSPRTPVAVFLFALAALLTFFAAAWLLRLDLTLFLRRTLIELSSYYKTPGWFFVFAFATLPFLTVLFSEDGALAEKPGPVQTLFHGALSFVAVLSVTPILSPSALVTPYGRLPVATSAFAAAVAGYLVAYWWVHRDLKVARALGGILCLALAGSVLWNLVAFEGMSKVFADKAARRVVIRMDARQAREILRNHPDAPLANYVMGSLALKAGQSAQAEAHLRKAAAARKPASFALNDLAEVLRRGKKYAEAERYARQCVECAPKMYVGWETLGSVLMDAGKDLDEAESAIRRACELSKGRDGRPVDVRMLVSLARVLLKKGDVLRAQETIREIRARQGELSARDRAEFEKLP